MERKTEQGVKETILFNSSDAYRYQDAFRRDHSQDKEVVKGKSMTIPDMSLSIPELLSRHARGVPLPDGESYFELTDDDDETFAMPELHKMDLAEIEALKDRNKSDIERLEKELADQEKAKALIERRKMRDEEEARKGQMLLALQEDELENEVENPFDDDEELEDDSYKYPKKTRVSGQRPESKRGASPSQRRGGKKR